MNVSAKFVLKVLFAIITIFLVLHLLSSYRIYFMEPSWGRQLHVRLDLNSEVSLPTWFSQSLLMLVSLLLGVVAYKKHQTKDRDRRYWALLSVVFLYLSIDEGATLHELTVGPIKETVNTSVSYLTFSWVILAIPLLLLFGLIFINFWRHLPNKTRWLFAAAFSMYVGGALGLEMIEAHYAIVVGQDNFVFSLLTAAEETLEMSGAAVIVYALLDYLKVHVKKFTLKFTN